MIPSKFNQLLILVIIRCIRQVRLVGIASLHFSKILGQDLLVVNLFNIFWTVGKFVGIIIYSGQISFFYLSYYIWLVWSHYLSSIKVLLMKLLLLLWALQIIKSSSTTVLLSYPHSSAIFISSLCKLYERLVNIIFVSLLVFNFYCINGWY